MAAVSGAPRKVRRISRACDYCHHRSIRCRASEEEDGARCQNCVDFNQPCTYNRPTKRRGVKARQRSDSAASSSREDQSNPNPSKSDPVVYQNGFTGQPHIPQTSPISYVTPVFSNTSNPEQWRAPYVASQALIMDLVEVYFEVIYPIFPFFHRPTFLRKVSRGEFATDRFLFAATMGVCALASARARDGAVFSNRFDQEMLNAVESETFFDAAKEQIPVHLVTARDHNCMRACALLAITSIQYGQIRIMHQHLGRYHALVAMDGLHDESNWPKDICHVEREERRRLFWSMYTLDVYSSTVWCGVIRCREAHSDVLYPTEIDDEMFDDAGFHGISSDSPPVIGPSPSNIGGPIQTRSWLCGWNFTTDLYRVLEHAVDHFRARRARLKKRNFLHEVFGVKESATQASVLDSVMCMYANLPHCFKQTKPITLNNTEDRYSFQAANIAATVQLLRMVLFSAGGATIEKRCQVANEVVSAFALVPVAYLRAISAPLLHHLAGIGSILAFVLEEPLSGSNYAQVRNVLLSMAQLLSAIDSGVNVTTDASERLRSLVSRIDDFMHAQGGRYFRNLTLNQHTEGHQAGPQDPGVDRLTSVTNCTDGAENDNNNNFPSSAASIAPTASSNMNFQLPPELLDDWSWAFDFAQPFQT